MRTASTGWLSAPVTAHPALAEPREHAFELFAELFEHGLSR